MLKLCLTGNGYNERHLSALSAAGFDVVHKTQHLSSQMLQDILPELDVYVLGGDERLGEAELSCAKKLRLISFVGTGYTSFIDEHSAKKFDITICNTPAVMAPAVAEHTIGLLIGLQRHIFRQNWEVKNSCAAPHCTNELSSVTVGFVGLGEIGTRIAKILRHSFDSKVIYASRTRKQTIEAELGIEAVSIEALFSSADVIILALPTNVETEYFINDALLAKTKMGVTIINTAGARLIEPVALKKYLDNNRIASAAFDGYYIEPPPPVADDPFGLLSLPDNKFIVTPHTAAKTAQSWSRMIDMAINNVVCHFGR